MMRLCAVGALLLAVPAAASANMVNTTVYPNSVNQVTLVFGVSISSTSSDIEIGGTSSGAALYIFPLSSIPSGATINQVTLNYQINNPLIEGTADFAAYDGTLDATNINDSVTVGYGSTTSGGESLPLGTSIFNNAIGGNVSILGTPDDPSSIFYLSAYPSLDVSYSTPSVPEPASLGLLSLGAMALLRRRGR